MSRLAIVAVGFAIVSALLGRAQLAIIAAIAAVPFFLTILRNLARGDR